MVVLGLIVLVLAVSTAGVMAAGVTVASIIGVTEVSMAGAGVELDLDLVTLGILSAMGMVDSTGTIITLITEVTEEEQHITVPEERQRVVQLLLLEHVYVKMEDVPQIDLHIQEAEERLVQQQQEVSQDQIIQDLDRQILQDLLMVQDLQMRQDLMVQGHLMLHVHVEMEDHLMRQDLGEIVDLLADLDRQMHHAQEGIVNLHQHLDLDLALQEVQVRVAALQEVQVVLVEDHLVAVEEEGNCWTKEGYSH
ncbi:MAG: hypothetical protein ACI81G_000153 [Gammaproteobacteria bacterium]|jgi:hypothetical protein